MIKDEQLLQLYLIKYGLSVNDIKKIELLKIKEKYLNPIEALNTIQCDNKDLMYACLTAACVKNCET